MMGTRLSPMNLKTTTDLTKMRNKVNLVTNHRGTNTTDLIGTGVTTVTIIGIPTAVGGVAVEGVATEATAIRMWQSKHC